MIADIKTTITQSGITYETRTVAGSIDLISVEATDQEGNIRMIDRKLYVCRYSHIHNRGFWFFSKDLYSNTWEELKNSWYDYFGVEKLRKDIEAWPYVVSNTQFGDMVEISNRMEKFLNEPSPWASHEDVNNVYKELTRNVKGIFEKMGPLRDDVNNLMCDVSNLRNYGDYFNKSQKETSK